MLLPSINKEALSYWRERQYTRQDLIEVARELDQKALLILIDFIPGHIVNGSVSQLADKTRQGHVPAVLQFFNNLQLMHKTQSLQGAALVLLEDGIYPDYEPYTLRAPILTFNRSVRTKIAMLIPDPAYMHSRGYAEEFLKLNSADQVTGWNTKRQVCFWRGAASGPYAGTHEWRKNPRCKLALYSREHADSGCIDAAISHLPPHITDDIKREMHEAGIIANYVPVTDFALYRYNIDIDGEFNAWKSCFLKLGTHTLLFKVESNNEQWYYGELSPWKHFVPVNADFSDLLEKIEWAKENDNKAKEISLNSAQLVQSLSYDSQENEAGLFLEELFSLQKR